VVSEYAAMTEHLLPDDPIELIARRFRVLGEPTRIRLLDLLRGQEASVQELTEAVRSSEQNVSKHLGVLRQAGIVRRSKRGNFSYYSIADAGVFAPCEHVCGGLAAELESLREALGAAR
jgi:DNA-binding transcriptional ArsR family regulator